MGNLNIPHGALIIFPLQSQPALTIASDLTSSHLISGMTEHHFKAFLFTDRSEDWVTYEITDEMKASKAVTIMGEKEQEVKKNPQGKKTNKTVLQLVKVVGKGKVENVRLYGSTGEKYLGHTCWVRYNNDPKTKDKMKSIEEIDEYAIELFSK